MKVLPDNEIVLLFQKATYKYCIKSNNFVNIYFEVIEKKKNLILVTLSITLLLKCISFHG